ncbi:DUF4142 domain-containing protein [Solwaraspora sp. WMMD937]|uniref:DUF4142 domain-containing protein n=1 Tax=Solwaraspora sp. WMMD937 TaxID=3016090 RepID=UPI00249C0C37|nr:DUF4142 domain-containing protein [Solwaraspora sp. WMMD937]WFE19376.1 DUF4142 domain-containing protein [Solwaraspora sp. WMMD937]
MARARSAAHTPRRLAAVLVGLVAGLLALPGVALAQPSGATQLAATDIQLLNGVRLAGLWEIPAGVLAAEKGSTQRVREVGAEIADQHIELDLLVVEAANELGVELPTDPTPTQQGWVDEMKVAEGARFDRIFVERLRAAHGNIFPVIGAIRASTRNDVVRQLAQDANGFVQTHMSLLESTGLVRYGELPPVPLPAPPDDSLLAAVQANAEINNGVNSTAIWVVLIGALALGTAATFAVFRRRY